MSSVAILPVYPSPWYRPRVQWRPNWMGQERRLCLTRIRWERGTPGIPGGGYSAKLSLSLQFMPRDWVLGIKWKPELWGFIASLFLLPCLSLRVHLKRSYGGIIP